jgi:hypothetical protein
MTDDVREKLIEDLAYGTTEASGVFVQDGIDPEELEALVDALGLVTDRKLRVLTEEGGYVVKSDTLNKIEQWYWSIPGAPTKVVGWESTLEAAVAAAYEARGS